MSRGEARSGPARRAMLRWAVRLFRRDWRQHALILSLMTVAVAVSVAGTSMVLNATSASSGPFGRAGAMADIDATQGDAARTQVAAVRRRFGAVEVISHRLVRVPGSVEPLDLRGQDPTKPFGAPLLDLRAGRYPAGADEVAVTRQVADLLSVDIGGVVTLGDTERTVVGLVENPSDLGDRFALIAPDEAAPADTFTLLLESDHVEAPTDQGGPTDQSQGQGQMGNFAIQGRGDPGPVATLMLVATALGMVLVGLIAAAGFVVVAQRRQRQLGLLAAIGATERDLRLVMVATGAIVGVVAAVAGGALGVVGWIGAAPTIEIAAGHRIDRFDLPWGIIAVILLLAVATATAAAWWPARSAARQPIVATLSGRPSRPLPVRRSSAVALLLITVGMGGVVLSHPTSAAVRPALLIGGVVAIVIGIVIATPAAIRLIALPAGRLPFAPRLALRDLARHQARSAAALAAITLTLGLSVAVSAIANLNEYRADEGNLSSHQLLIRNGDVGTVPDPRLTPDQLSALDAHAEAVASSLDAPTIVSLDVAVNVTASRDPNLHEPVTEVLATSDDAVSLVATPVVATPEVLQHLGIDPSTIDPAADLLTRSAEDVQLFLPSASRDQPTGTPVQRIDLPAYSSGPTALITEAAMRRHGWTTARVAWLVDSPQALTTEQIADARATAAPLGLAVESRSTQDGLGTTRTVATTVGILLALAILAMTIGLIRGESGRDLRTLTATGAGGGTRRALTATTAGALTVLGGALGTIGAYLALGAAYHGQLGELLPLPLVELATIVVGLPLAAAAVGWLLAGREPSSFSRQALD